MIVEFSVKNYRSIRSLQTISFAATGLKSPEEYKEIDTNNISEDGGIRLLKTVGIYGANGSGKSNIIKALQFFLEAIGNEASSESNLSSLCDPFLFCENAFANESFFQLVLILDNKKYRYGFTVSKNLNPKKGEKESNEIITSEWLYGTKEKNAGQFFTRTGIDIEKEKLPNEDKIPPLPYEHTLFITHASAFDRNGICASIRNFIKGWTLSNFNGFENFRWNSVFLLEQENRKIDFLDLLSSFNLKYDDVIVEKDPNKPELTEVTHDKVFLIKNYKSDQKKDISIRLNLSRNESSGTQKIFDIGGLLLRAFSMPVSVFIILDEVDSNFHPSLLIKLVGLFNNPAINKSKSQLLFTSHDTNLMAPSIMRRDQFYFTEKNESYATRVYSLADLKGIRNDADFAKQYLMGIYGALPILGKFTNKISQSNEGTLEH